ncbi:50S ribosomal protein L37ae [Candidatus Pacearchaeota archaeon]|nr:50S ribosomal protein L37ae [Candidatus Pacearchaeota archaeon]
MRTKKVKAAGRLRAGYGKYVRGRITEIEGKQRKKQACPYCKKTARRISKGIWKCNKCGKKFASHAYYINK